MILMKISLIHLSVLFFIVTLSAVQPGSAEQKIIGISHHWMGNEYNINGNKILTQAFTKTGYKVFTLNANGNSAKQVTHVKTFIDRKVSGIVIFGGVGNEFGEISMKAWEANIPLICHMMFLPGALTSIVHDNWEGSTKMAVWLANQMHGHGEYIILDLPDWHILEIRKRAIGEVMRWFPNIKRVGDPYMINLTDPVGASYTFTKTAIQENPDLKGVFCTWGMPIVGAIKAVREMGKADQIAVAGTDTDKSVLNLMAQKGAPRTAVVGHPQDISAHTAVKLLSKALEYKNVQEARDHLPAVALIDIAFTSNTDPKNEFKPRAVLTLDEAWDFFHHGSKRPW